MELEFKQVRNTLIVRVRGEIDMLVSEKMRKEIDKKVEENEIANLIMNLEKVNFIDSSGLGVIIGRYKKINASGGRMCIVGANPSIQKILVFSGINKLVPLYNTEQEVVQF
ncbi:MAG TPA: anti-sigma F factor antagonist [Syntrophomonadaceae bacterium]|nr:anti-sigma F factor antagonist [Syntrophomonadaceae bacterium]